MNILVFGEVLWDMFPERAEIGGTALNFSAHASKLGATASLITSVGKDALGQETLTRIRACGIDDRYVREVDVPTATCQVSIHDGAPTYDLVRNVSYDFISAEPALDAAAVGQYEAVYMGTLAQRGEVSRENLRKLLDTGRFREVFCDLNIRQTYYNREIVEGCLRACTILKVSREEYTVFEELGLCHSELPEGSDAYNEDICRCLCEDYDIRLVLLTLDKDGAMLYERGGKVYHSAIPHVSVVSTVGAGDSFSACFLVNYLGGVPAETCVDRAVILSSYIVTQLGAVPEYAPGLLEQLRDR